MERIILHADLNSFYASVECLLNPELKSVPMAVMADVMDIKEARDYILLLSEGFAQRLQENNLKCRTVQITYYLHRRLF